MGKGEIGRKGERGRRRERGRGREESEGEEGKWGGVEGEGEVEREGRENSVITTAHRFWFGWRRHVDCRSLARLKIHKERKVVK